MGDIYTYWFTCAVDDENSNTFFFGRNLKGFFKWEKAHGKVIKIDDLRGKEFAEDRYGNGIVAGNRFYFAPHNTDEFAIYDPNEDSLILKRLYSEEKRSSIGTLSQNHIHYVFYYENHVYFLNREYPIISKLDIKTNQLSYIENLVNYPYLEIAHNTQKDIFYFTTPTKNAVYRFDAQKESLEEILIKTNTENEIRISSCLDDGDRLLITSLSDANVYLYDIRTESTIVVSLNTESNSEKNRKCIYKYGDRFFFLPLVCLEGDLSIIELSNNMKMIGKYTELNAYRNYHLLQIGFHDNVVQYVLIEKNQNADVFLQPERVLYGNLNLKDMSFETEKLPLPEGMSRENISDEIDRAVDNKYWKSIFLGGEVRYEGGRINLERYINTIFAGEDK